MNACRSGLTFCVATAQILARRSARWRRARPRTDATAFSASVSKTGCRSKVERPITLSTSLVAVCCSSATRSSLLRACSSVNSRTFSMAMTAWSAKVSQQLDLLLGEGTHLHAADEDRADRPALAQQRRGRASFGDARSAAQLWPIGYSSSDSAARSWTWMVRRSTTARPGTRPAIDRVASWPCGRRDLSPEATSTMSPSSHAGRSCASSRRTAAPRSRPPRRAPAAGRSASWR